MHRVVVVGNTGSGKTTLARALSARLGVIHVELDALHWDPGWTEVAASIFRERVDAALPVDRWVVDGNYSKVRDLVWNRADTLVWLDYPLPLILTRLARRTTRRIVWREELWNGNRERFSGAFLSRDSLFVWAITTHRRRRREYDAILKETRYGDLQVIRLSSPGETRRWLASI